MTSTETDDIQYASILVLDWSDLAAGSVTPDSAVNHGNNSTSTHVLETLEKALGANGTGLIAIRNVPGFVEAKQAFLPRAHDLVQLPSSQLLALEDPVSLYNAGWSHGKERMGDTPDFAKGSYYYNPVTDCPGSAADRQAYPVSYPCNVWPAEASLPHFQTQANTMGAILKDTVVALARHIDQLAAQKVPDYPQDFLYTHMQATEKVKARLLYYFPLTVTDVQRDGNRPSNGTLPAETPAQNMSREDSWIGWHNDSGFFTALAGDLYVDHETGQVLDQSPDPAAGLYVIHRSGQTQKVNIPPDCVAVQMGECLQIVTGGAVTATPHCVRGVSKPASAAARTARIALPVFVDVPPTFVLQPPAARSRAQVLEAGHDGGKVPPLAQRWKSDDQTFGDFLQTTFSTYYNWSNQTMTVDASQ